MQAGLSRGRNGRLAHSSSFQNRQQTTTASSPTECLTYPMHLSNPRESNHHHKWPPLLVLAKKRRWSKLEEILSSKNTPELSAWLEDSSTTRKHDTGFLSFKGQSVLHLIMEYQPTVHVVRLLIARMRESHPRSFPQDCIDMQGQNPLFHAVIHNCDYRVVKILADGTVVGGPAVAIDSQLRTPLHWACTIKYEPKNLYQRFQCGASSKIIDNMIRVIEILIKAYPRSIWMKDQDGLRPYDVANQESADSHVCLLLDIAMKGAKHLKYPAHVDHSDTEGTCDVPLEVSNSHASDFEMYDDVSSIGNGGVSTIHARRRFGGLIRM